MPAVVETQRARPPSLLSPIDIEALPDLEYLVEGILPVPAFGVLFGPPGAGKSFIALSIALAVAGGGDWLGRRARQGRVLYVAAEGVLGMKLRLQAYRSRFGVNDDAVRFIGVPFDIRSEKHVIDLIAALAKAEFTPDLIIVDTLARVAVGADENSAKDMGQVVDGFETLKRETRATVLVIHHTRKDGLSERGSSALRGAADVMIGCEKDGNASLAALLSCEKMKDDEPFKPIGIRLEKVALANGKSSLVVAGQMDDWTTLFDHASDIIEQLANKFAETGATHGELKQTSVESLKISASTFDRNWRDLKKSDRIRAEKRNGKMHYFAAGVSVAAVSEKCQTPTLDGVMSRSALGGDTDTSAGGDGKRNE